MSEFMSGIVSGLLIATINFAFGLCFGFFIRGKIEEATK